MPSSFISSYNGYDSNGIHSDSFNFPLYIDSYTFEDSSEELLKISERINNFNVWEKFSYLVLKDNKTLTEGYFFKDDDSFERVYVKLIEEELIVTTQRNLNENNLQQSLIPNGKSSENEAVTKHSKSLNNYLFYLRLERGGREGPSLMTWSYILTINIGSLLFFCCMIFSKIYKNLSYTGGSEPSNPLI